LPKPTERHSTAQRSYGRDGLLAGEALPKDAGVGPVFVPLPAVQVGFSFRRYVSTPKVLIASRRPYLAASLGV